jgi:hypothetical protein
MAKNDKEPKEAVVKEAEVKAPIKEPVKERGFLIKRGASDKK